MGSERGPEYYDENLQNFLLPVEESHWRPVYKATLAHLPATQTRPAIVDLGCGTGRLARLLIDAGYTRYLGVDFSEARVAAARAYVPEAEFRVGDVFDPAISSLFPQHDTFIVLEVLEHMENDLELLCSLPLDANVVFSVPNYDDPAHVRWFANEQEIVSRYGEVLTFTANPTCVRWGNGRIVWIFSGQRRSKS